MVNTSREETLEVRSLLRPLLEGTKLRKHAEGLFDPGSLGTLTRDQLMAACTEIFLGRKNLATSLRDLDSIIDAIDTFLVNVQFVVLFLAILVVFSTGELADVAVTSGRANADKSHADERLLQARCKLHSLCLLTCRHDHLGSVLHLR